MNMKIVRGTTPTLNFILPFGKDEMSEVILTFSQNGEKIIQYSGDDLTIEQVEIETENSIIIDENHGDGFISNDYDYEYDEYESDSEEEPEKEIYCNCSVHMKQEETLSFKFYPAAEKNIVVSQFKIVASDDEVYVSDPLNFRVYGDTDGQVRPLIVEEESEG